MNTLKSVSRWLFVIGCLLFSWHSVSALSGYTIVYEHPQAEELCGPVPANWDVSSAQPYNPKRVSTAQRYNRTTVYDQRILVCMQTSLPQYRGANGVGWVVSPEFSRVGYNNNGAFYLGTDDGNYLKCHNKIYHVVLPQEDFQVPQSFVVPAPTPIMTPATIVCGPGQQLSSNKQYCIEVVTAYVQPCPNDLSITGKARFVQDRIVGSVWKKIFSFGLSAGGTLIAGGDTGTALRNGAIGVAMQTGQTMINPSEGAIALTAEGLTQEVILPKGKNYSWSAGEKNFQLVWRGDLATVYSSIPSQGVSNYACYSYRPKEASNLGVYVSGDNTTSSGANKIQSVNSTPIRPSLAPTRNFPVGTMGYCSRPMAGSPAKLCQVTAGGLVYLGDASGSATLPIFGN